MKFFFTNFSLNKSKTSRYYPENNEKKTLFEIYKNKTIKPNSQEVEENNPSRSAKLRYVVRSKDNFIYPVDLEKNFFITLNWRKHMFNRPLIFSLSVFLFLMIFYFSNKK